MQIYVVRAYRAKSFIRALKITIALVLIFVFAFYTCGLLVESDKYVEAIQALNEKRTVILDAGHGGEDPGVIGVNGIYEKDLNLAYVNIIGNMLEEKGFAVIYTRCEDKLLYKDEENIKGIRKISDLKNRVAIANEYPNALFVSIHMNSYSNPKYYGLQVYYGTKNTASVLLAECIRASAKEKLQNDKERKTKKGEGMYILENSVGVSVIVECGFLTNKEECEKLSEKEYQNTLCFAIVCGIIEYTDKMSE